MKYQPAETEIVVTAASPTTFEGLASLVGPEAHVETMAGDASSRLVRFATPGDLRTRVRELQKALGKSANVFPLLRDPSGLPLVPTGQVRVRFTQRIADKELRQFASEQKLKLIARDVLAPEQATFQVAQRDAYLLDVIERAGESAKVRLAWPETKGRFTKSS
jgi:hypothetical protein